MFRPRIIPVLLLKNRGLVKTVRFKKPTYIGDPINAVRIFNDLEADELIFLDITATNEGRTVSPDLVGKIGDEAFMPFAVGGGIGSLEEARLLLQAGAEKVVLNSASVHSPHLVREISEHFGSQSLIVSIDARRAMGGRYRVATHSGKRRTPLSPLQHAENAASLGAGEILINSIDRDGMMGGYDLELIGGVTGAVNVPVIAFGGAGRPADFAAAVEVAGASAAAAGSLFVFHGPRRGVLINYPEKNELERLFSTG